MSHRAFFERWFLELWGQRNSAIIDECVSNDCEIVGLPRTQWGRASFHAFFKLLGDAYPQVLVKVDDCISDGEAFAIRCSGQVRCREGKMHDFTGSVIGKVRDGQIVQAFNQWGFHDILESTGHIPRNVLAETWIAEARKGAAKA